MRGRQVLAVFVTWLLFGFGTAAFAAPAPDPAPGTAGATKTVSAAHPSVSAGGGPTPERKVTRPAPDRFDSTTSKRARADASPKSAKARRRAHKKQRPRHPPLRVTPPLGRSDYVFPIVGPVFYGDSYGVSRPDAPGGWHHGDDIFAPLGAPVVAVADGTVTRVGWERLGGWRLWVHDSLGNQFYYAHLSGYTALALRGSHVSAGQALGFIGDTGDAITTPFHLHFEVHPASLLYLGEDGAVDPTSYLQQWRHLGHVEAPRPVLPALPAGTLARQAQRVFAQLLAVRPSIHHRVHRTQTVLRSRPLAVATDRPEWLVGNAPKPSVPAAAPAPSVAALPHRPALPPPAARPPARKTASISGLAFAGLAGGIAFVMLSSLLLLHRSRWGPLQRLLAPRALRGLIPGAVKARPVPRRFARIDLRALGLTTALVQLLRRLEHRYPGTAAARSNGGSVRGGARAGGLAVHTGYRRARSLARVATKAARRGP